MPINNIHGHSWAGPHYTTSTESMRNAMPIPDSFGQCFLAQRSNARKSQQSRFNNPSLNQEEFLKGTGYLGLGTLVQIPYLSIINAYISPNCRPIRLTPHYYAWLRSAAQASHFTHTLCTLAVIPTVCYLEAARHFERAFSNHLDENK